MKIVVTDIDWDVEDEENAEELRKSLPKKMVVIVNDGLSDDEIEDVVSDSITDETGWCHNGFNWKKARK